MATNYTDEQRKQLVQELLNRVDGMDLADLRTLKKSFSKEMVRGRSPFGDRQTDEQALHALIMLERELAKNTPPESEAEMLMRQHHVSRKVAESYLARQKSAKSPAAETKPVAPSPWESQLPFPFKDEKPWPRRKDIKPAPEPEPRVAERRRTKAPASDSDLRPYRMGGQA